MFGYVIPEKNRLFVKDLALYQSIYCGICKSAKSISTAARAATNYDSVYLCALLHNLLGTDFEIKRQNCILHPFKKRAIAQPTAVSKRVAAFNVLLLYHKLRDDVEDGDAGITKKTAKFFLGGSYKKAVKAEPALDAIIRRQYEVLRKLEKSQSSSYSAVSDTFGVMMRDCCLELCEDKNLKNVDRFGVLCYNIGKWIYLIDAVDDIEKDAKSGAYNVFLNVFGVSGAESFSKKQFIAERRDYFDSVFAPILAEIRSASAELPYQFNSDLIYNVSELGIPERTRNFLECSKECKIRM